MKIKVYITKLSYGQLSTSSRGHMERYTTHGGMEASSDGLLINNPTFAENNCKKAIEIVKDFAKKHEIKYKIYDVEDDWAAFLAMMDGIKVLPTVKIGRKKIEGVPSIDELASSL